MAIVCDVRIVTILERGYRVYYPPSASLKKANLGVTYHYLDTGQ